MNRRDWLKCLLAAPAAGAAVALAKSEPKPEFPRYFVTVQPPRLFPLVAYVEWRRPGSVFFITPDGVEIPSRWPDFDICVNEALHSGRWREITAAEAEALLKPTMWQLTVTGEWVALKDVRKKGYGWFVKDCFSPKTA